MDRHLTMNKHVTQVAGTCYAQLRNISHARRYLTMDAAKTLVHSLVTSRLDYCNSLVNGCTHETTRKLQLVQNRAARIITRTPRRDHITPILKGLHWLPVRSRSQYKTMCLVHKIMTGNAPSYLNSVIERYVQGRDLRSADGHYLRVPGTRTLTYGSRAFQYAAPRLWNSLPPNVRNQRDTAAFKCQLKHHLFSMAYCTN